jgi:type IV secretion system protein VirB10
MDAKDSDQLEGDRTIASVAKSNPNGLAQKIGVGTFILLGAVAIWWVNADTSKPKVVETKEVAANTLPPFRELPKVKEPKEEEIVEAVVVEEPKLPLYEVQVVDAPEEPKELSPRLLSSGVFFDDSSAGGQDKDVGSTAYEDGLKDQLSFLKGGGASGAAAGLLGDGEPSLSQQLQATKLEGYSASTLEERNYLMTKGTFLTCNLETAISSDVPGMTTCRLSRDIYSNSGSVLLLERGTKLVGEYRGGFRRGQHRLFILWTRAETPKGVIINLDSPGSDALGRGGVDGYLDNHFWERFGSALLLSLIDDVGDYIITKAEDGDSISFSDSGETTQDMASITLRDSVGIPPTLLKHQGETVNVITARDLDFASVYSLANTK